jgi:hypothetical protein
MHYFFFSLSEHQQGSPLSKLSFSGFLFLAKLDILKDFYFFWKQFFVNSYTVCERLCHYSCVGFRVETKTNFFIFAKSEN